MELERFKQREKKRETEIKGWRENRIEMRIKIQERLLENSVRPGEIKTKRKKCEEGGKRSEPGTRSPDTIRDRRT